MIFRLLLALGLAGLLALFCNKHQVLHAYEIDYRARTPHSWNWVARLVFVDCDRFLDRAFAELCRPEHQLETAGICYRVFPFAGVIEIRTKYARSPLVLSSIMYHELTHCLHNVREHNSLDMGPIMWEYVWYPPSRADWIQARNQLVQYLKEHR